MDYIHTFLVRMKKRRGSSRWRSLFLALIVSLVVAVAIFYSVRSKKSGPGAIAKKYADALKVATQFLHIQKCTFSVSLAFNALAEFPVLSFKVSDLLQISYY